MIVYASYTLYDITVPRLKSILESLTAVLRKAEATPHSDHFFSASLHPTMEPLSFQIYAITVHIQRVVAYGMGYKAPDTKNDLDTYAKSYSRIQFTEAMLAEVESGKINSRAAVVVPVPLPGIAEMPVADYVTGFALPNVWFHLTTAYDILRKEGVELGKMDFLTPFVKDYLGP